MCLRTPSLAWAPGRHQGAQATHSALSVGKIAKRSGRKNEARPRRPVTCTFTLTNIVTNNVLQLFRHFRPPRREPPPPGTSGHKDSKRQAMKEGEVAKLRACREAMAKQRDRGEVGRRKGGATEGPACGEAKARGPEDGKFYEKFRDSRPSGTVITRAVNTSSTGTLWRHKEKSRQSGLLLTCVGLSS